MDEWIAGLLDKWVSDSRLAEQINNPLIQ